MSQQVTLNVTPPTAIQYETSQSSQAIKVTNRSFYDLQVSGYGVVGGEWIFAGGEYMLYAHVLNAGTMNIIPFNTTNLALPLNPGPILINEYLQGETLPKGVWPVSVPQSSVNVTNVGSNTLTNEGSAAGLLVIDLGDTALAHLMQVFNDGSFTWSVDQAGVAHVMLKGSRSGNALTLGQTGDTVEMAANVQMDGVINAKSASNLVYNVPTSQKHSFQVNSSEVSNFSFDGTNSHMGGPKKLDDSTGNNLADWTSAGLYLKGNPASAGPTHYQADGTHTDWVLRGISASKFTGTSAVGTQNNVAHNFKVQNTATAPDFIFINDTSGGSMTWAITNVTTTTFSLTAGQAHTYEAWCIKFT